MSHFSTCVLSACNVHSIVHVYGYTCNKATLSMLYSCIYIYLVTVISTVNSSSLYDMGLVEQWKGGGSQREGWKRGGRMVDGGSRRNEKNV